MCLSLGAADYQEYVDGIEELEAYVAYYLKQDLGRMQEWDLGELRRRFGHVLEIIRAQNGRGQDGEVRGDF